MTTRSILHSDLMNRSIISVVSNRRCFREANTKRCCILGTTTGALLSSISFLSFHSTPSLCEKQKESNKNENNNNIEKNDNPLESIRDLFKNTPVQEANEFLKTVLMNNNEKQHAIKEKKLLSSKEEKEESDDSFFSKVIDIVSNNKDSDYNDSKTIAMNKYRTLASAFINFAKGNEDSSDEQQQNTVTNIVSSIKDRSNDGDIEDTTSLTEIFFMLDNYKDQLHDVASKYMDSIDFSKLNLTSLLYYVEYQDEIKNPSYKRRIHRFCKGIDMDKMDELNEALSLALLSYADSVDEIRYGLQTHPKTQYELVHCDIRSEPCKPAHFLAIKKNQSDDESSLYNWFNPGTLHVIMVVRGTKTVADALTDLLCDTKDYQGGRAHSFILGSGQYLAKKHIDLLHELCKKSGKSKIDLTIIGHSLGAGAASIAGMEFNTMNDESKIRATVIGFGCPAILSKDLVSNNKTDFITTVINDDDIVPRMSGATIANLLMNLIEFNWLQYAQNDIRMSLDEIKHIQPYFFNDTIIKTILERLNPMMEAYLKETLKETTTNRLDVDLFPPGKCIHLYRDGIGFSGCYVPNDFFVEIDVSRRMIHDHLIHSGYQKTLLEIARQRVGDHHYSFEQNVEG